MIKDNRCELGKGVGRMVLAKKHLPQNGNSIYMLFRYRNWKVTLKIIILILRLICEKILFY